MYGAECRHVRGTPARPVLSRAPPRVSGPPLPPRGDTARHRPDAGADAPFGAAPGASHVAAEDLVCLARADDKALGRGPSRRIAAAAKDSMGAQMAGTDRRPPALLSDACTVTVARPPLAYWADGGREREIVCMISRRYRSERMANISGHVDSGSRRKDNERA